MTFEQIDSLLHDNKRLQRTIINNMMKRKNHVATVIELISLTNHQEELERKRAEEIESLRISIRKQISEKSNGIYTNLPVPLRYLAGELLQGNEEYVLNQAIEGNGQTIAAETIMKTGFTTNQAECLSLQMKQLNAITRSFEEARSDSEKLKEVNFVLGAMDGNTLKHARALVVLANEDNWSQEVSASLRFQSQVSESLVKVLWKT